MRAIAVDWSGDAHNARSHIWLAEAQEPGNLTRLESGRDREQLANDLLTNTSSDLVIGLDFAFAFPAWFTRGLGLASAIELWAYASRCGESWLAACDPPFWGRPGRSRPALTQAALRRTDQSVPPTGGISPKSIFQIGGAGAVGTGSVRGMPLLERLHAAGAALWPFTCGGRPTVVEIYPRLMTGAVRKSDRASRSALLASRYPRLEACHRDLAIASEDAFDAAVSALVMIEHMRDLSQLPPQTDSDIRLEGRIWHPRWREDVL